MYFISYYIQEIRLRIFYIVLAYLWSFLVGYTYKYEFFYIVSAPVFLFHKNFIFLNFSEGLSTILTLVNMVCVFVLIPYVLYQFWSFRLPSWYLFERQKYTQLLYLFGFCTLLELSCIYVYVFPKLCEFFMSFELKSHTPGILFTLEYTPRIASYITFVSRVLFSCYLLLQLPFLFGGLFSKKIINWSQLCSSRKLLFFLSLFLSACISPPDFLSQLFLTLTFSCLYEIIIFLGIYKEKGLTPDVKKTL